SPDGKLLGSASRDGTVRLWDSATSREVRRFPGGSGGGFMSLAISPNGKVLAAIDNEYFHLRLWDVETGKLLHHFRDPNNWQTNWYVVGVAFSPDGKIVAAKTTYHIIHLFDVETGKKVLEIRQAGEEKLSDYNHGALVFSPDGKWIVAGRSSGPMQLFDA